MSGLLIYMVFVTVIVLYVGWRGLKAARRQETRAQESMTIVQESMELNRAGQRLLSESIDLTREGQRLLSETNSLLREGIALMRERRPEPPTPPTAIPKSD